LEQSLRRFDRQRVPSIIDLQQLLDPVRPMRIQIEGGEPEIVRRIEKLPACQSRVTVTGEDPQDRGQIDSLQQPGAQQHVQDGRSSDRVDESEPVLDKGRSK
jgi:hypothetical protein